MSDINKLYDTALGIYDLELALTVAQQAQKVCCIHIPIIYLTQTVGKDPREYLPFLQALQDMNELRRKYTIDDFLGRCSRALESLHAIGKDAFKESRQYIIAKDLYAEAFHLYRQESQNLEASGFLIPSNTLSHLEYKIVTRDYATYLEKKGMFREAGFGKLFGRTLSRCFAYYILAYESLDELDLAIVAYQKAGLWSECLYLASKANNQDIADLALALAANLREAKDYQNAARVCLDYCADVDEAVQLLCQGNHFGEAMRVVRHLNIPDTKSLNLGF